MHLRAPVLSVLLSLLTVLAACGKKARQLNDYEEGDTGFVLLASDWVDAAKAGDKGHVKKMAARMALPDPNKFFTDTFGAEAAERMLAEYNEGSADFAAVSGELLTKLVKDEGRSKYSIVRVTDPEDPAATGFQMLAMRAMKQKVPLYTLRLQRPDGSKSFTLWSFVYVDGGYRMVGRMQQADPKPRSKDMDMLLQLPTRDAKEILEGN
jgi:hypothetical protein